MRILIIEDDSIIGADLQFSATDLGFKDVSLAHDESEAIECASAAHPDIVLSDVRLGSAGSGVSAANAILKMRATAVVFVTGLLPGNAIIVDAAGVVTLGKPYNLEGLNKALRSAARRPAGSVVAAAVSRI